MTQPTSFAVTQYGETFISPQGAQPRSANGLAVPGEISICNTGVTALSLPQAPAANVVNRVANYTGGNITVSPSGTDTISAYGTVGADVVPTGTTHAYIYNGGVWYRF
jgi:hypothetical protein